MLGVAKVIDHLLHVHSLVEELDTIFVVLLEDSIFAHTNLQGMSI